ncbi:hypothetical protein HDG33_001351 [Paraburkholderia sp. Cpub6]|nr:hypothetical protein [Paraburkholderia sp. Cpub6]
MALTDVTIRNTKPGEKQQKLYDGGGLLLVTPTGSKRWMFKYRFAGKEKSLALGVYPDVPLADARKRRDDACEKLAANIDPGEAKKAGKRAARLAAANSFEAVALAWMEERGQSVESGQCEKTLARFRNDAFPWLGKRPIAEIDAPEILAVLKRVDSRGARFTAHRLRSETSRVFRFAIKEGYCKTDPARDLVGAIPPAQTTHFASITEPAKVAEMSRAVDAFSDTFPVLCALNRTKFIRERREMMQEWADYLDRIKAGAEVIPIKGGTVA